MADTHTLPTNTRVLLLVSKGQPETGRRTLVIPDVRGRSLGHAVERIERMGVTVQLTFDYSAKVPANRVIAQYPPPGSHALAGSLVAVQISQGAPHERQMQLVPMPSTIGKNFNEAVELIEAAGLVAEVAETIHPTALPGDVVGQLPNSASVATMPNLVLLRLRPLFLGVALLALGIGLLWYFVGPGVVPNVTGMSIGDATRTLQKAGYFVGSIQATATAKVPTGEVLAQVPAFGAPKRRGTSVFLVVDSGEPSVLVPDLVGTGALQANLVLQSLSLVESKSSAPSARVPRGFVISQSPEVGTPVAPGTTVSLVFSAGKRK